MRVLVTGSAGFLGRHFVLSHLADGDEVYGVDDMSAPGSESAPDEVMEVTLEEDVLDTFSEHAHDFDLVYHFAAPVGGREKIEGDPLFNAHSLALDSALFRWATTTWKGTRNTKRVVYPSSSAVYGVDFQGIVTGRPLREIMFDPTAGSWAAPDEMYGFTKLAGEMLAWKAGTYGLDSLCIRPFSGYGEGQSFDYPVPSIAARALRREDPLVIWGSGDQARDFIHVDDIVRLTRRRLERPLSVYDSLNLGSGTATSFRQLATLFADIVGYKPEILNDESKPQGVTRRWADISKMSRFGKPIVPLEAGLARVLADVEQRIGVPA